MSQKNRVVVIVFFVVAAHYVIPFDVLLKKGEDLVVIHVTNCNEPYSPYFLTFSISVEYDLFSP